MNLEEAWDYLIETGLASEDTLRVVTSINGYSLDTLEDVLYAVAGYHSFDQLREEDGDFAHCADCDSVIDLDNDEFTTNGDDTYCEDCGEDDEN